MRVNNIHTATREFRKSGASWRSLVTAVAIQRVFVAGFLLLTLACAPGDEQTAATGGMSGTGISQGSVGAFGSIFVNGIEWDLSTAAIEIDGVPATESDLRLGMVVRVEGDFQVSGTSGTAESVFFDDDLEGPIENSPIDVVPGGLEKTFEVLGITIIIHEVNTVYDDGAGFLTLDADDVVEVSGFVDNNGAIRATRVELKGQFPANSSAELHGIVSNLMTNPNGTGSFNLGTILVHYVMSTTFDDVTPDTLADGDFVEVEGELRINAVEIDASEIELEDQGLVGDADEAEIEGIVSNRVSDTSFSVSGTPVDATNAVFEPTGFVVTDGAPVEVEGSLVNGILVAEKVESEADDDDVRIEAAVISIDNVARTLLILGVTVTADAQTQLKDDRDDDDNFMFSEIQPGDWLEVRGRRTGPSAVVASRIERDDDDTDVFLRGPVTFLDVDIPLISIVDQPVPLDPGTLYFDETSTPRTEDEFFRLPGDVMLGDIVRATDVSAVDLQVLSEADEVELE